MSKYFDGPEGFYYNVEDDMIYYIEWSGARVCSLKTGKDLGASYDYYDVLNKKGCKNTVLSKDASEDVYLGE